MEGEEEEEEPLSGPTSINVRSERDGEVVCVCVRERERE
jgi:hypothetical protein